MSYQALLCQNKILSFFTLDLSANAQTQEILQPTVYTTLIYHVHYPVVYYEQLYQHFKHCLPKSAKAGNIRLYYGNEGKELPSEMPIGLYLKDHEKVQFRVGVDLNKCLLDAFKIVKNSWKKAFEIINPNRKCDYIKTKMSQAQTIQKFKLYKKGFSHRLQKENLYEGTVLIVKGKYEDLIMQRKYPVSEFPKLRDIVKQLFCLNEQQICNVNNSNVSDKDKIIVKSHTLEINLEMSTKLYLDEWTYNDGYCYMVLENL